MFLKQEFNGKHFEAPTNVEHVSGHLNWAAILLFFKSSISIPILLFMAACLWTFGTKASKTGNGSHFVPWQQSLILIIGKST